MLYFDTREHEGKNQHILDWLEVNSIPYERRKLDVGDYMLDGDMTISVDRKANMNEVESNLVHQHDRFRRECERAVSMGIHLVILVEGHNFRDLNDVAHWTNPRYRRYMQIVSAKKQGKFLSVKLPKHPPLNGNRLAVMMQTMSEKYGIEWRFCRKNRTGEVIWSILNSLPIESNQKSLV